MMTEQNLEGKIKTIAQLKKDLKEYKPDIIVGTALGLLAAYYRHHGDNPNFASKFIPTIATVFLASKAITYVLAVESGDKDRMEKRLRELKGEIVTIVTGLGLFYGSYVTNYFR